MKRKRLALILSLALFSTFVLLTSQAALGAGSILRVTPTGLSTWPCGSDWSTDTCALQTALTNAASGDEIWVATGTYKPTTESNRLATFTIESGVAVYGGFAGGEISREQRDPVTHVVTLSGNIGSVNYDGDNSSHVVTASSAAADTILDGVTISDGDASKSPTSNCGGGMYNYGGDLTVSNVIFRDNSAINGGGMCNKFGDPNLNNVVFNNNFASDGGGGMYNNYSSPTLNNVTFTNNRSRAYAGGMYNNHGAPSLTNVTFNQNRSFRGGGMYNYLSNPILTNSVFTGNSVFDVAYTYGGGIYNYASNPILTNVTIDSNSSNSYGGGIYNFYSTPVMSGVTFRNNYARYNGGGMYNDKSDNLTLRNITFSGNWVDGTGGAMFNDGKNLSLTNVTFRSNSAPYGGSVLYTTSPVSIRNSILWDNPVVIYEPVRGLGEIDSSVAQYGCPSNFNCSNTIITDPLLGSLGSYGGNTQTIPLLPGSPAINAGSAAYCTLGYDQRGLSYAGVCDIGAFESQGFTVGELTGDNQSALINAAFAAPLGLTVTANNALEPASGGQVTFTAPGSGASAVLSGSPATIGASGVISVTAVANSATGVYSVTAHTSGAAAVSFSLTNIKADTTTSLASASPSPSTYGQVLTFTATVMPSAASGTVTFKDDIGGAAAAIPGCEERALSSGQATCATDTLGGGVHIISAEYSGNALYNSSTSSNVSQTVNKAVATLTLDNLNLTYDGNPRPVSATTSPPDLAVVITYTSINGTPYGPSQTAPTEAGTYQADAIIVDANYHGAASATLTIAKVNTALAIASSPNPSLYDQPVTLTASVIPSTASGSVTFKKDGETVAGCEAQAVSGGQAVCAVTGLSVNTHIFTATYNENANHSSSVSGSLKQTVSKATPAITLASSQNPSERYQSVTFTATLSAPTTSGTVAFKDGAATIAGCGTQAVSGGQATCTTTALDLGTRTITAEYSGDDNYNASVSSPLYQIVQRSVTTTALISSLNPANLNQTVTFTATVTPTPTSGTVTFKDGGVTIPGCEAQVLSGGQATCASAALNVRAHFITAEYNGSDESTFSIGVLTPDQVVNCISAITVTNNADSGNGSLRYAIANICASGTITFAGDYTITLASTLTIDKNLTVDGSGHTVTISGNRGVVGEDEASNTGVSVFSVGDGDGDGVGDASIVFNLKHLTVTKGYSRSYEGGGGGLWVVDSTANVSEVTFLDNWAAVGGGLSNIRGTVNLTNTTFISNTAFSGGGMYNQSSNTTLTHVTFISNTASLYGGGLRNVGGSPTLSQVDFISNTATTGGGGMYNSPGNPTLTDVIFRGNSAGQYGGGLHNWDGSPVLINVAMIGNSANDSGGGMYNDYGDPILINVTFSGNTASYGGGMGNAYNSNPTLSNVTFNGNSATVSGGGLYNLSYSPSNIQVQNSLLWGNNAPEGAQLFNVGDTLTVTVAHSVVQGGYISGTNIISGNPLLGTLGSYGGETQTIPLLPGSPAIDAGDPAYCSLGHDQRGVGYTGACDIGAFDSQGFTLGSPTGGGQSATINAAFAAPLGLTVTPNNPVEPVIGGQVTFAPHSSDATAAISGSPAAIGAGATVSAAASANSIGGTYTVTASTAGMASGLTFSLTNLKANTTVALTTAPNPSTYAQSITFTATVSPVAASGMVTFKEGSGDALTGCEAQVVTEGQATCTTTLLSAGVHSGLIAVYNGDASYNGSASGSLSQAVIKATAAINWSGLEQTYDGEPKPVIAVTSPLGLTAVITYTGTAYGPSPIAPTEVGAYQADAAIVDADYQGAAIETLTIAKADTSTGLVSSLNPSEVAQTVTFTASVGSSSASGTVTFKADGAAIIGCEAQVLNSGQAYCSTADLPLGAHNISAEYNGDEHYQVSIGSINQQVGCRSYIQVASEVNAGEDSLRQAIANVCPSGEITFAGDYTIHLTSTLTIDKNMTVSGAGNAVTLSGDSDIDGDGDVRVISVNTGIAFNLRSLTIAKGNAGGGSGGGLYTNGGTLDLSDVTFHGNRANTGGGMYTESGGATLTNMVFSGNYAGQSGGGMEIADGSTITLTNVTLSGNQAAQGSALDVLTATLSAANTILWGNLPAGVDQLSFSAGANIITFSHSLLPDACPVGVSCTNILSANPQFIRQPQPGADAVWGSSDDDYGDLHLDFASPAIDAGTDCTASDGDGQPRPSDGNGDGSAACDMGAYEAGQMICSAPYTFTSQSGLQIQVDTANNLACLYVDEIGSDHTNATAGMQSGQYWRIHGLTSDKTTLASGFSVTLTMPTPFIPDAEDKLCRYTGSGQLWDCAQTGFDADAWLIWRSGISAFSDWTVGNNVDPTNVTLVTISVHSAGGMPLVGMAILLALLVVGIFTIYRSISSNLNEAPKQHISDASPKYAAPNELIS